MLFCNDIKLDEYGDAVATKREQIFSVTLFSLWLCIGILIASAIEHAANSENLEYMQAPKISNDKVEFLESMQTDVGNAFVDGTFVTVDPVTHSHLNGSWMHIEAEYQSYEHHTRLVTYTDDKGRTHTRTESYWSWDTYDRDSVGASTVRFCGHEFPSYTFGYNGITNHYETVNTGFHKRICFTARPKRFKGAVYAVLKNNTISNKGGGSVPIYEDDTAEELYNKHMSSCGVFVFWLCWTFFGGVGIVIFVFAPNNWLEDDEKESETLPDNINFADFYPRRVNVPRGSNCGESEDYWKMLRKFD